MRIISYNVNGLRSAISKGLIEWMQSDPADIICLQEIKASKENVDYAKIEKLGFHTYWFPAQKKGYSGVAVFSKIPADRVVYGNKREQSDFEGRVIRTDFGDITLINAYYPSGTSGEERQQYKYHWLDEFLEYLAEVKKTRKKLIVCGDYNIAHREIDIHDPKGNKNSSGFLPEERAWMDRFLAEGFIDSFRAQHPGEAHRYSWWSQRFPSVRIQNKGWRIDYICISKNLAAKLVKATIYPDVRQSDHCPVFAELALT